MRIYQHPKTNLFNQGSLREHLDRVMSRIESAINMEDENYILNVGETSYIDHLDNQYLIKFPDVKFEEVYMENYEADVPIDYFDSRTMWGCEKKHITKIIFRLIIPIEGDSSILKLQPSTFSLSGISGVLNIRSINIDHFDSSQEPISIKSHFDYEISNIKKMISYLEDDITAFNQHLKGNIKSKFDNRKKELLSKNNLIASIGFPIKRNDNTPDTFSIQKPQMQKPISIKPIVCEKGYKSEPTLDIETYNELLTLINDAGKNFERMPSIYKDKEEEHLRDHILFLLDPHFKGGSATGETFNKRGKTDIQLRSDSSVVFIAECKFWSGKVGYKKTIDQLLKYLTWRDTKTSIVIFVKQKEITKVISTIESETSSHSNYIRFINKTDQNWFNYIFHINDDKNREVRVAVQIFHIPQVE